MRPVKFAIPVLLCFITTIASGQGAGTSCSIPNILILDSVSRNYPVSPTSGNSAECTTGFSGSGKITVFSFTTNSSGSCVLVYITTSAPVQKAEVSLYTGCSGGGACQGLVSNSSVCFVDGTGYWAPIETYTFLPNTTYYLRVWTPAAGTLTMSARNYSPPNNLCSGASWIGPDATDDNNACAKPSTEVAAWQLCAFTLENTAFYSYIVESDGTSSIQLNNISCDNMNDAAETGFQIGFFVGSCGSLIRLSCATGSGGSVTASTGWLAAGTQVFVAIDGTGGSNCSYTISAFNAVVLSIDLKYFTSWKRPDANRLTWLTTDEKDFSRFEIEKSVDGVNFISIGTRTAKGGLKRETAYSFDDYEMKVVQYYRLKQIDINGKFTYSNIIRVNRDDIINTKVIFSNKVTSLLALRIIDMPADQLSLKIIDNSGREVRSQNVRINPGENSVQINTGSMNSGFYYLILSAENYKRTFSFVKS